MALERRYKGIARNGRIELESGAQLPDGTEVTVLFADVPADERPSQVKWAEAVSIIESFKSRLPRLPDCALSTDMLYD
ncbi:MAG: hypothetical protein JNM34_12265 [Chthonomonadaceae bacterium]|nr:hypothetical protein [Chthonomonadaceae bacterium]